MHDSPQEPHPPQGPEPRTVSFYALGCRANQEEMECLVSQLGARGFRAVPFGEPAAWTVVNTCTVTAAADSDSRQILRAAARRKGAGRVVATGCLAQRDPRGVAALTGVDWVIGNAEKADLAAEILAALESPPAARILVSADPTLPGFGRSEASREGRRQRASLKIQDGCDEHCTFCVIPRVRGRSRSRSLEEVLREARTLAAAGYRELVLTGINTALWGRELPGRPELPDLVEALARLGAPLRLRLNSLEPQYVGARWLERLAASGVVCAHLHFPLQSGDERILRRMNRRYTPAGYARLVERARRAFPGAAVGADVMAGFPGEDGASFERTRRFLEEIALSYLHVFTYSERPETAAPRAGAGVPGTEKRARSGELRALGESLRRRFALSQQGTPQEVLLEARAGANAWQGLSGNFLRVRVPWRADRPAEPGRTLARVRLTGLGPDGLMEAEEIAA